MTSNVAPPKSTGGGGFVFEDQVCAWLFACMLADEPPLSADLGTLDRLDFQARPDGWLLDDVLLSMSRGAARSRCALSIKSNLQFRGRSAPPDFVELAWTQFLQEGSTAFDPATDLLGLVTAPIARDLRAACDGIIGKAIAGDPVLLPSRLATAGWANDAERGVFDSLACPPALAEKYGMAVGDTGRLVRRLRFLDFDFDAVTSESRNGAIRLCRSALRSGELSEATELWSTLLQIAADLRPKAGFIVRPELLDRLRTRFHLNDRPDHRADWQRLQELSLAAARQVATEIGGRLQLSRGTAIDDLELDLECARGLAILGRSGAGKSALARLWFERRAGERKKTVWFDGRSFERPDFAAFEADLRLSHSIPELVASVGDRDPVVVLDGLDRVYDPTAFRLLLNLLAPLHLDGEGPWRLVVTCQTQEWARLQDSLHRIGIFIGTWKTMEVAELDAAGRKEIGTAFPTVAQLLRQSNLGSILNNLKILDMVAWRSSAGDVVDTMQWVGESSVAAWFWDTEVSRGRDGPVRARFARLLAERQADSLRSSVTPDEFEVADLQPLGSLLLDRVCRQTPDERIGFEHDLYGDWSRLKILVSRLDDVVDFLKNRLGSPVWHRAVRLLGLHLLEHLGDVDRWRELLSAFGAGGDDVAQDLLLESPLFAADQTRLLETVLPDLLAGEGKLLQRLLTRFLAYATIPDPRVTAITSADGADDVAIRAKYRYPNWAYWPAVIRFLHTHRAEVLEVAPVEVARIVEIWLQHMPVGHRVLRREAGELGLALGTRARKARERYTGTDYENRGLYYRVALAAAHEMPDEVAAFALEACERIPGDEKQDPMPDPALLSKSLTFDSRFDPDEPAPEPWPDGPRRRVDDAFRKAVVEDASLMSLMQARPKVAREVALGVLIKPRRRFEWHYHWSERHELDLDNGLRWHPAFYTDGPFLAFLRINFPEGLELIGRVVDFATGRWEHCTRVDAAERAQKSVGSEVATTGAERPPDDWGRPPATLHLDSGMEARELLGDARVYGWSAGLGNPPAVVEAALMALEQHFYLALDQKQAIGEQIQIVFGRARSVAFLKVLCDVGKRDHRLFEGALRPLLAVPEIYDWDMMTVVRGRMHMMIGAPMRGSWFVNVARRFHELPHRRLDLRGIALGLMINRPAMRQFFDSARSEWERKLRAAADDPLHTVLEQLIISFDARNYEVRDDPEHGTVLVNVRALEREAEHAEERRTLEEGFFVTTLPMRCRQMIDEAKPLAPTEVDEFWRRLRDIDEKSMGGSDDGVTARSADDAANAIAGGIAVLVRHHSGWLAEDTAREEWCLRRISEIVLNPPAAFEFDTPESDCPWTWDCFAAEIIPFFWARNPGDMGLRWLSARLVFAPHYVTVRILFQRCAEYRATLGEDFSRLRRLAFECAYVRGRVVFIRNRLDAPGLIGEERAEKFSKTVSKWADERVRAFVRSTSKPRWDGWDDLDTNRFAAIDVLRRKMRWDRNLDLQMILVSHAWMPTLSAATNAEERQEWLTFWREALAFVLRRPAKAATKEGHKYPFEDERWVLARAATALLDMTAAENPKAMWKAVMSLPTDAHHWPERFLESLHRTALARDVVPEGYVSLLRAILGDVIATNATATTKWPYHEDVWDALVGIDSFTQSYWEARHAPVVASLVDVFEEWWNRVPAYDRRAARLARWLERPAAALIRLRGLEWLERRFTAHRRASDREEIDDAMASLLATVWQHDEAGVRVDAPAFAAFQSLLRRLADEQNGIALDLLGRIGGLV